MLIHLFNLILIALVTIVSYKYFSLKEKQAPASTRTIAYMEGISSILDKIEVYDKTHAGEMAKMAEELAAKIGLSAETIRGITYAALLHDIGEALLPREILKSVEKLDEEQMFLLRTHPLIGELQLKNENFPLDEVPALVRWHHEKFDGSGYPDGLSGEEIPWGSRILALVDAVSAMKAIRPYRKYSLSNKEIGHELDRLSGLHFDPQLVELWKSLYLKPE
jgi:HD-GYP domain-containing protein (c-di-GMP phosphodiesterase class II)